MNEYFLLACFFIIWYINYKFKKLKPEIIEELRSELSSREKLVNDLKIVQKLKELNQIYYFLNHEVEMMKKKDFDFYKK